MASLLPRFDKDLNQAVNNNAETFFFFQINGLSCNQFPGLHAPGQLMEDGPFKITKYLYGTKELVQIIGESGLHAFLVGIGEEIYVWLLALRLGW